MTWSIYIMHIYYVVQNKIWKMLGSPPDGEPILNPQVMCLYICNNNTEGRGGGGSWCLLGKSEIADSSPALAFKFQRNKMFPPCSIVNIEYCGQSPWLRVSVLGRRPTGLNFESCVWRAVTPHSSHHLQVSLTQFSLYVYKCGVEPHLFHFIAFDTAN